jgi:Cu+-exporting ATPase
VAARHGILIKDVDTLQKAHAIKALIFDKTGTLTQGRPVLASWSNDEQLRLAAALQQASEHPLALAMREAVGKEATLPQPEAVEVRVGAGIVGQVAGHGRHRQWLFAGQLGIECRRMNKPPTARPGSGWPSTAWWLASPHWPIPCAPRAWMPSPPCASAASPAGW